MSFSRPGAGYPPYRAARKASGFYTGATAFLPKWQPGKVPAFILQNIY
jgi:hypothetical protein